VSTTALSTAPEAVAGDFDRAALERLGIRYDLNPALPLTELDGEASRAVWNQARLGDPVDEDHVEELVAELERGAEFPPIVFYRDDSGNAAVLSGNHRREAYARVGRDEIPAYEASGLNGLRKEDPRVLSLIYEANHGHGLPVSLDHRVHQALVLIENGYNVRAAAGAVGIPEARVRDHYDAARATRRLEVDLGVDTSAIPISVQRRIVSVRNDKVAKAIANVVPQMDKKTREVNELVKSVNAERSEDAQLAIVTDYAETLRTRTPAPSRRGRPPREQGQGVELRKLDTALGTILRFDVETLRGGLGPEERERLNSRVGEAIDQLKLAREIL
jgi:ParB-like nuclease domain